MRLIDTAKAEHAQLPYPPRACAVSGRAEGQFVDFQTVIDRPGPTRLYIAKELIEEAAKECFGMVPKGRARQLEDQLAFARKQAEELREVLETAADLEEKAGPNAVNRRELAANAL